MLRANPSPVRPETIASPLITSSHRNEVPKGSTMERRAWVRIAINFDVTCRPPGGAKDCGWPGRIADVSAGGVGLLMRHRFERGTELLVEIASRAGAFRRTVRARVVHARMVIASGDPRWLVGCSFAEPLSDDELKKFL